MTLDADEREARQTNESMELMLVVEIIIGELGDR